MKKVYLIFSLLLMFLGINTAYAGVTWGGTVTDPSTLTNGSKIIIHTTKASNGNYTFLSCLVDSLLYVSGTEEMLDPYVTFTMETASGKNINGEQAYYLKNDYCNKYITYVFVNAPESEGGSILSDGSLEMRLTFTDDAAKATPFIIKTQADGAKLFNYTGTEKPALENSMMIISECTEQSNKLIALNVNFASPYIANYGDGAAWWQVGTATITEDYTEDLGSLYTKVQNLNYKGGTAPGCYDQALVDAFTTARTEANDLLNTPGSNLNNETAKAAYEKLETAYLALITGTEIPVHEGYFRISSAYASYIEQQGAQAIKTVYATNDGKMKWKDLDNEDATMVWQFIDRHDGTWLLYNVGTGQYANGRDAIAQSATYTLTNDSTDCGVEFISLGQSQFNIKPSSYDIHTGGHNNGAGTSGDIVGWDGGIGGASAWYVTSVDESQIPGFQATGAQNMLNRELELLYNKASEKYAIGSSFTIDYEPADMLVTQADFEADANVIVSNQDQNTLGNADGNGYVALVDQDTTTYWHSFYGEGYMKEGGYLQFKLNKAVDAFAVYYSNRKNQINVSTQLDFYVSNDTTDANSWVKAGSITGRPSSTDNSGNGLNYQSSGFELDQAYQYVRVYWTSANGFTHFTEFHFQPATLSTECQNATLGDVAKNLLAQLNNASSLISSGTATREAIDALQAAYDAYVVELADPTNLKAKADSIQGVYNKAASPSLLAKDGATIFVEGQPGVYTDAAKAALKTVLDEVQAYLDAHETTGDYTKADIQSNLDKLTTAFNTFKATATGIKAATATENGNWYYLSASQHYFDITGTAQNTSGEGEAQEIRKGKVYVDVDLNNETSYVNNASIRVTGNKDLDGMGINSDMAKWRFVNMGDTAYAIQNKATGLYIGKKTGGNAGLSITPVGFTISEIGYATFIFDGKQLNGAKTNPIHVQTAGQILVFWNNYDLGNGSCFDIEDTKEPANNVADPILNLEEIVKGKLYTKCYPVTIEYVADKIDEGAFPYQIATVDTENKVMTLTKYEDYITAGMPFFYIGGGSALNVSKNPSASDTTTMIVQLDIDKKIAQTPLTENGLVGNYYPTNVVKGFGVVNDEDGVQSIASTTEGQEIGWNSAYIDLSLVKNGEPGEITVPLTGDLQTAIKDAIIDAQTGNVNVYSIDGILIKKNVKVSEATKGLAKGIYIVGKQKIAVK